MNNNFKIIKLDHESYDFLILATSYENPLSDMSEIGEQIQVQKARLLFDLTLINGTSKNRYMECDYMANRNQLQQCSIVTGVDESIKKISQTFFEENEEIVKQSILPNALKYLLKTGAI